MVGISVKGAPAPRLLLLSGVIGLLALAVVLAALNGAARWADGYVAFRAPAELDPRFWAAWITGLIAALLSSWVWALKPDDVAVRLYALSGAATLAFCFAGAALFGPAALPEMATRFLIMLNVAAACAFGVIMIVLFSVYPTPLAGARWLAWGAIGVFSGWMLLAFSDPESLFVSVHRITLAEMALIVLVSGAQVLAARGDPVRFAIAVWLGATVILGAGGFIATVAAPSAFGAPPLIANEYAFGFFLIIYAGLAVGLLRYRVFGLGRWAFQILFNAGAALALLIVDVALIAALSFDPAATIGVSLFAAALLYLPARGWLWSRLARQRTLNQATLA
ncbi:MAG TPA: histidine kinase, partial [Terricaulis sp.]|nr:histidine kinase [Terricaulis sp.]